MRISRNSAMRAATSSTESTSSAISMRRMLAKALMSTGTFEPLGFSNSSAGPPVLTERSANSVISRIGSTSKGMRFSSLCSFEGADKFAQIVVCHVWKCADLL